MRGSSGVIVFREGDWLIRTQTEPGFHDRLTQTRRGCLF